MPQDITVQPALLENDINELQQKINLIQDKVTEVHLDIMDGEFVPNTTVNDPAVIQQLNWGDLQISLHLMIANPNFFIKKWAVLPMVTTIYVHFEATVNLAETIALIRKTGKKVGIALNPHTSTVEIKEYIDDLDAVMIMGVEPGFSGQAFNADVLRKITYLHELAPNIAIAVDGGVNGKTKDDILKAGATVMCANSYLFQAEDIDEAIMHLKNVADE